MVTNIEKIRITTPTATPATTPAITPLTIPLTTPPTTPPTMTQVELNINNTLSIQDIPIQRERMKIHMEEKIRETLKDQKVNTQKTKRIMTMTITADMVRAIKRKAAMTLKKEMTPTILKGNRKMTQKTTMRNHHTIILTNMSMILMITPHQRERRTILPLKT